MTAVDPLDQFYQDLREEINIEASAEGDGCSKEEMFTRVILRRLEDAGEAENARECRDRRESVSGQTLHKLNGYALSEGLETLDLYVSLYQDDDEVPAVNAQALKSIVSQVVRFVNHASKGYTDEVEESAPVYELARTIRKEWKSIVRVNFYVLTNGRVVARDLPAAPEIRDGMQAKVEIRDLTYLKRLADAEGGRIPIELEFDGGLPCLPFSGSGGDYLSYLTILSGAVLAKIYEEYGARLLEQNVRAFLQATGKVNRAMRTTIQETPEMFFAYNNGIAATAGDVDLERDNEGRTLIRRVRDFQIVNGGQTTASIFHTMRNYKADLSSVAVQVKLTVIQDPEQFTTVVSNISRYSNSQNKVSDADLTANHPYNVVLEQLSRSVWAPAREGQTSQTHWFFERARGQYRNDLNKEGVTPKRRKAYSEQNPSKQKFDKEEIARFTFACTGKPWLVVRGRQKAYAEFIKGLRKGSVPDRIAFEDLMARAILFRTAELLYGMASQAHVIGDLRYISVPYALSWLTDTLSRKNKNLDLYRIWKTQALSPALSKQVRSALEQTDRLIREKAPGGLYGEWAKKEEAWEAIRSTTLSIDHDAIKEDLESPSRPRPAYGGSETADLEAEEQESRIRAIPVKLWERLHEWSITRLPPRPGIPDPVNNMKLKLRGTSKLTPVERRRGTDILDLALEEARHLFDGLDEMVDARIEAASTDQDRGSSRRLTVEDAVELLRWERKNGKLKDYHVNLLKGFRDGRFLIDTDYNQGRMLEIVRKASWYGYEPAETLS